MNLEAATVRPALPGAPLPTRRGWLGLCALLALIALLVAGGREARSLHDFYQTQERLPLWDMAGHGWGGVELQQALAQGAPLRFLDRLNRQDKWPFGYSLLLLPFFWAAGPTFAAATLLSTVLYALVPPLLLATAREVDRGAAGIAAGVLAGIAFLAAPLHQTFAILIMRETAGVALTALALTLYLRARRLESSGAWRLAGLSTLALVLCKVNYALLSIGAIAVVELLALPDSRRAALLRRAAHTLWPWAGAGGSSRGRIALAIALDLILLGTLAGFNAGVALYALLVVLTAFGLRWVARGPAAARTRWRNLPTSARQVGLTFVLPLWLWCLSPDPIHPKTILAFLRNRETGPPLLSPASLLYYPRVFLEQMSPGAAIGWALLLLALAGALHAYRSEVRGARLLAALVVVGLLLATFHPYKEPRFFLTTAPFLTLLATLTASRAAFALGRVPRAPAYLAALLGWLLVTTGAVGLLQATPPLAVRLARLEADYKLYSSGPAFLRPLATFGRWARGGRRIALLGSFNELSDSLLRWTLVREVGFGPPEVVPPLSRFRPNLPPTEVRHKVETWTAEEGPERILALRLLATSPRFAGADYQSYNAWQLAAIRALETDPAWSLTRRRTFPGIEVEILLFEPKAVHGRAPGL